MASNENTTYLELPSAEQALKELLGNLNSQKVKAELSKWLDFGLTGDGGTLHTLTQKQLDLFLEYLPKMAVTLYCYQSDRKKGESDER